MEDLIKAFQIFLKYGNPRNPTSCEHDVMIVAIDPGLVSIADKAELSNLGFIPDDGNDHYGGDVFYSYRYGSR